MDRRECFAGDDLDPVDDSPADSLETPSTGRAAIARDRQPTNRLARLLARRRSYTRYIRDRPGWLLVLVFGRVLVVRQLVAWASRRSTPARDVPFEHRGVVDGPSVAELAAAVAQDGIATGLRLDAPTRNAIVEFAAGAPCFRTSDRASGFASHQWQALNERRQSDVLAAYYFETVEDCAAIAEVVADPLLRAVATRHFGRAAVHVRTRLWWSFPARRIDDRDRYRAAQDAFHFDLNDWSTLKFFFYLTDCDRGSGAHMCIPGSHRRRRLRHQLSLFMAKPLDDLVAFYGPSAIRSIEGKAGSGFAENPFIFHTGTVCRNQPRLILEVEFGCREMPLSYKFGTFG